MKQDKSLATLSRAERMLAEVASTQDAIQIINMAEAARVWAQRAKLGTASINHATSIKLKAEIKLADCVDAGQERGEISKAGQPERIISTTDNSPSTLADLGLNGQKVLEARRIRDAYTEAAIDELVESATLQDREITRTEFVKQRAHVSFNGGENEWYTPATIIEAARTTFQPNGITLDPATSPLAQQTVQADTYYTKDDDGLTKTWHGNIWLNPPYAQPLIGQFVEKLVTETSNGNVTQAIILVNNATDTKWGQKLLAASTAVCFTAGRIRFIDKEGKPSGAPLQGQMIVYLGNNPDTFTTNFTQFGTVLHG
jgi:ParB family chromosome partitioning protein